MESESACVIVKEEKYRGFNNINNNNNNMERLALVLAYILFLSLPICTHSIIIYYYMYL